MEIDLAKLLGLDGIDDKFDDLKKLLENGKDLGHEVENAAEAVADRIEFAKKLVEGIGDAIEGGIDFFTQLAEAAFENKDNERDLKSLRREVRDTNSRFDDLERMLGELRERLPKPAESTDESKP